jgi:hypothetical protein
MHINGIPYFAEMQKPVSDSACVRYKEFVAVSDHELERRAIHKEEPDLSLLKQAHVHAIIVVHVFVNDKGEVICSRVVNEVNPYLAKLSLDAARNWRFKPFLEEEHKSGMQGNITFRIDF